jgi:hypothetical protein
LDFTSKNAHKADPTASKQAQEPDPGIIWVASGITRPDKLPADKFVTWYENTHVQEVLATGGVPAAARYQNVRVGAESTCKNMRAPSAAAAAGPGPGPDSDKSSNSDGIIELDAPWLTVYEFPSLAFRHTDRFKALDGQTKPKGTLLEDIFANAVYATRFSRLLYLRSEYGAPWGPAEFVVSAAFARVPKPEPEPEPKGDRSAAAAAAAAAEKRLDQQAAQQYGRKLFSRLDGSPGLARIRVLRTEDSSVLDEFQRRGGREGVQVLIEFKEVVDWKRVTKALAIEGQEVEVGLYKFNRGYGEFEKQK